MGWTLPRAETDSEDVLHGLNSANPVSARPTSAPVAPVTPPDSASSTTPPRLPLVRAVEVVAPEPPEAKRRSRTPRVAAIIVTWNRHKALDIVLRALAAQEFPAGSLDVVVVDNASTDGTVEFLVSTWAPAAVVDNSTTAAHHPEFSVASGRTTDRDDCSQGERGFRSLTVVRNHHNLGGCGGFNTGLAFLEAHMDRPGEPLDYAWLVDDDIDLPPGALAQLLKTGEADPTIGLVGSRTVDFADRRTTIETTIYFDHQTGLMGPDPAPTHPEHAAHLQWVTAAGGTRGELPFTGVRPVDVVSACSLLARWNAVKRVGFWDHRYFIYCDDADWCLRFPRAGFRVVLDLDAVVYHTYWLSKLTPVRAYYAQRNLLWLIQKNFSGRELRRITMRRLAALLLESRKAMTHCRLFHAEIIRRTAQDIITGRGGKLDDEGPAFLPLLEAFDRAAALRAGATVTVMCSHPESIRWAEELRLRVHYALADAGRVADRPRWVYMVRDNVPDPAVEMPSAHNYERPERIVFAPNRDSKWAAQRPFLRDPPTAVVVFDQHNDFPLLRSRGNIHIDRRRAGAAQYERDGIGPRLAFLWRWAVTAVRCGWYGLRVKPYVNAGKYG